MAGVVKLSDGKTIAYSKEYVGRVVSDKMDKTVVVSIERMYSHPLYGKTVREEKKYKVHDEFGKAKVGDIVKVGECRRFSKTKHMVLIDVVESFRKE